MASDNGSVKDLLETRKSLHWASISLDSVYNRANGKLPGPHQLILSAAIMAVAELRHWADTSYKEVTGYGANQSVR